MFGVCPFTFPEARGDGGRGAGRGLSGRLLLVGRRGSGSQSPGGAAPGDPGVRASGRLAPGSGGGAAAPSPGHVRPLAPPFAAASPGGSGSVMMRSGDVEESEVGEGGGPSRGLQTQGDRKSTRLNSSH